MDLIRDGAGSENLGGQVVMRRAVVASGCLLFCQNLGCKLPLLPSRPWIMEGQGLCVCTYITFAFPLLFFYFRDIHTGSVELEGGDVPQIFYFKFHSCLQDILIHTYFLSEESKVLTYVPNPLRAFHKSQTMCTRSEREK